MLKKEYINLLVISLFSFFLNFFVASRGVFPVDTFIHYDTGFRILLGELPIRDFWIVHGFVIDFIQALFFYIFGNNWYAYIIHSSIFNSIIVVFTYYIFLHLNINSFYSLILSICIGFLAYPVSGTPFLDLHSSFFSILATYLVFLAIKKNIEIYWLYSSILLCFAFLSKQVPAFYVGIVLFFINIYISVLKKNIMALKYFFSGGLVFLTFLIIFLYVNNIEINKFILQIFLFPKSIGLDRYSNYDLGIKNVFLNFKLIYFLLIPVLAINFFLLIKKKKYYSSKNFLIFLTIISYVLASIFHQIFTKNQIYIFFIIPILAGILIHYISIFNFNNQKIISYLIIFFTLFATVKYTIRFDINRKFHELIYTDISKAEDAIIIDKKLSGLNWISPYNLNPKNEINNIQNFISIIKKEKDNIMVITEYSFFSSLVEKKLYSPSRTYDDISFPNINNKFYEQYKLFLVNKIKDNQIKKIYFFSKNNNFSEEVIFNYISKNCFEKNKLSENIMYLKLINCNIF